jgi:hypothetical protein
MGIVGGMTSIIGTILAILTFYFSTYLPYINGQTTPATEAFTPVLQAIPGAEAQHNSNNPDPDNTNTDNTNTDNTNTDNTNTDNTNTDNTNTDTNPPICTIPDDIIEQATGPDGAQVSFEVSCEDDVDRVVNVNCNPESGETFPIGETVVTCSAEDSAGNRAEESFTITVEEEEEEEPPIPDDEEPPIREGELIEEPPVNDTEG